MKCIYLLFLLLFIILFVIISFLYSFFKKIKIFKLFVKLLFFVITLNFFYNIKYYIFLNYNNFFIQKYSNILQSFFYKISTVWSTHEGSLFLWFWLLSIFIIIFEQKKNYFFKENYLKLIIYNIFIFFFFLIFINYTSTYILTLFFFLPEQADLNPLLQDPTLIIHPPILYLGYTNLLFLNSFFFSSIKGGNLFFIEKYYLKLFTLNAWFFLTLGIALGSWWAYYELGWGGFWFWDPVENISLLSWLLVLIFLHLIISSIKNNGFTKKIYLFTNLMFLFALIGMFLIRSGLLNSVHSFTVDHGRGFVLLLFILIFIFINILIYINNKKSAFYFTKYKNFSLTDFKSFIYFNNIYILFIFLFVAIGTFCPIIFKIFNYKNTLINTVFFNILLSYIIIPILFTLNILHFQINKLIFNIKKHLLIIFNLVIVFFVTIYYIYILIYTQQYDLIKIILFDFTLITLILFLFINIYITFLKIFSFVQIIPVLLGHIGFIVLTLSIVLWYTNHLEISFFFDPGDVFQYKNYTFIFRNTEIYENYTYISFYGDLILLNSKNVENYKVFFPEKQFFFIKNLLLTKSLIHSNYINNIYIIFNYGNYTNNYKIYFVFDYFITVLWISILIILTGGITSLYLTLKKILPIKKL